MSLAETALAVALNAVAVALLGRTTWTAVQSRERPSAGPFVALVATLTTWALCTLVSSVPGATEVPVLSTALSFGEIGCALLVPGAWAVYALGYAGRGTGLTRRRVVMLLGIAVPVVLAGVTVVALDPSLTTAEQVLASLIGSELLYLFGLFVYATYLLVDLGLSHARVANLQIGVLTLGVAAPYLGGAIGDGGPVTGVSVGLLAAGALLSGAVRRYPVMTGFPKADYVARTRVVEALREGVVVLDWDDHVLDVNAATAELFDRAPASMIGEPIASVVDGIDGADLAAGTTGTVTLRTTKGRRQFQFSVSAVDDAGAGDDGTDPVARTVLLRDVTDRRTREERLAVLNRVLRHNVRNELDVVLAHAERIDDDEVRAGIRESATDLVALSERAREAEEVMTTSTDSPEPVDLSAVAESVTDEYRSANPEADITLSGPDELVVSTRRTVVREVLSELVDNAITHSDESRASVDVSVRPGDDAAAELAVADDGPGIPERERRILADGNETQLEHGRGLGLWFVNWAVRRLGGDVAFGANDPRGSVVTVRLYDADYAS